MFIPRVKFEKLGKDFELKLPIKVYYADATATKFSRAILELMPYLKLKEVKNAASADFVFETRPGISAKPEYYEIKCEGAKLAVSAKDARAHSNALATIAQLISYKNEKLYIFVSMLLIKYSIHIFPT